jgi:hypothetical protein
MMLYASVEQVHFKCFLHAAFFLLAHCLYVCAIREISPSTFLEIPELSTRIVLLPLTTLYRELSS